MKKENKKAMTPQRLNNMHQELQKADARVKAAEEKAESIKENLKEKMDKLESDNINLKAEIVALKEKLARVQLTAQ